MNERGHPTLVRVLPLGLHSALPTWESPLSQGTPAQTWRVTDPRLVGFKPEHASEQPAGLVNAGMPGPHPPGFWFRRSWTGLRICISNKVPGDAEAVDWTSV